jgi:predicted nucleotidyltransferase
VDQLDRASKVAADFAEDLKTVYGTNLISVVLYGSAASGEFRSKGSNINILTILDDAGLENLKKISKVVRKFKYRRITPVFLTERYIDASRDVFPVEFLDMKDNHKIIYGKDILSEMSIDPKNMYFQCEHELKARLINLKRLYLKTSDAAVLRDALFKTFGSALHILRTLIGLKDNVSGYKREDVLKDIARVFKVDVAGLGHILEARNRNLKLSGRKLDGLYAAFVKDLEGIVNSIDKF